MLRLVSMLGLAALAACGDDDSPMRMPDAASDARNDADAGGRDADASNMMDARPDAPPPDAMPDADPPTDCMGPPGLYVSGSCEVLAEGVRPFAPEYELWSDGADKERFVFVPAGTTIDTTDPNHWIFPAGTRFYKTFSIAGMRLETRLLEKVSGGTGPAAWAMRVFVWNEDQDGALEATEGVEDVLGTEHDVPAATACAQCHTGGISDVPLGFGAIQLAHDELPLTLATLVEEGLLTDSITDETAAVPGSDVERAALGYLHANCGGCHGGDSPAGLMTLALRVGLTSVDETGVFLSAVGQPARAGADTSTARIEPGMPNASEVYRRMTLRMDPAQMPPLATEMLDDDGLDVVRLFIESLPPR